jgi:phosphoglucosamine mutase
MTAEIALKTGRALAIHFADKGNDRKKVIIGKDTRLSGDVFENALTAGLCSMGVDVFHAGVIPTAGAAYLARTIEEVAAAVVISASHNPYEDNGIKVFNGKGYKLDDASENRIEQIILDPDNMALAQNVSHTGRVFQMPESSALYHDFLKSLIKGTDLSGMNLVIDCSNGASSHIAPKLFTELGCDVTALFTIPNGTNINAGCGSEHIEHLIASVVEKKADLGLAFDGDADRLIAVDMFGRKVSGDQLIAICAKRALEEGTLAKNTVVTTVMSNMGLGACLKNLGITHVMSQVGDRNVMLDMIKTGAVVGGEDSGHMIFLDHHTTGDGIISALKLLKAVHDTSAPLHSLAEIMSIYPQKLINVDVNEKPELSSVPEIAEIIKRSEKELGESGRVLVRYSGTQSMCRVMVEAPTDELTEAHAVQIADVIGNVIGKK